jgi:alkaline phosphatase D
MLGYCEQREVLIWVQTTASSDCYASYWKKGKRSEANTTEVVRTDKRMGYTAKLLAENLEPGTEYEYQLFIDGETVNLPYPTRFKTQTLWQFRTDPPEFSIATGSCSYISEARYDRPGKPYGSNYQIFDNIREKNPDLMIWLGDNVYYREPDWATRSGMLYRYTHSRSLPELQHLLASTNHYAIWDDHDFGPNDSDGTWIHKETAWEVFQSFWGNPTFGIPGLKGCTSYFKYHDIDVFLLDNRYYRTPNDCATCPRTELGREQLEWFKAAIAQSTAPFKLVAIGGQVLTTSKSSETYTNLFPDERAAILDFIEKEQIKNVVFLTGDRHFTELSAYKNKAGNWVYDLTTSPLTSGAFTDAATKDKNDLRVEGSIQNRHNFSILKFSGPRLNRQLEITVFDADGNKLWANTLPQSER